MRKECLKQIYNQIGQDTYGCLKGLLCIVLLLSVAVNLACSSKQVKQKSRQIHESSEDARIPEQAQIPGLEDSAVKGWSLSRLDEKVQVGEIDSVEAMLKALPRYMQNSYALMHTTESRHIANEENPRIILFSPDGRSLLAMSTDSKDPLYNLVEVISFDDASNQWEFTVIDFDDAIPERVPGKNCEGCHGSPGRPIWGSYPSWPNALFNEEDSEEIDQTFTRLMLNGDANPRLNLLEFKVNRQELENTRYISSRFYGPSLTVANTEIGAIHGKGLWGRLGRSSDYHSLREALLFFAADCHRDTEYAVIQDWLGGIDNKFADIAYPSFNKLAEHLGLNIADDLMLDARTIDISSENKQDFGYWFGAFYTIPESIGLHVLWEIMQENSAKGKDINDLMLPIRPQLEKFHDTLAVKDWDARADFNAEENFGHLGYYLYRDFRWADDGKVQKELCRLLMTPGS